MFLVCFVINANSSIYTVDNFKYTTNFQSVKKNRPSVIEKIKIDAFKTIVSRFLIKGDTDKVNVGSNYQKTIKSFNILDENKNNKTYDFLVKVEFDQDQLKKIFNEKNLKFIDFKSKPILTLIVKKSKNNFFLWENDSLNNLWTEINQNDLLSFVIPSGDLKDRGLFNDIDLKFYELISLDKLSKNYGLNDYLFLVIDEDRQADNLYIKYSFNNLKFNKKYTLKTFQESSIKDIFKTIQNDLGFTWKEIQILTPKKQNEIKFIANLENLNDYLLIKKKIKITQNINTIEDKMVSSKKYEGLINFSGDLDSLLDKLNENNVVLEKKNENWILKIK